ncbi:hypothetical protein SAMN05518801_10558 [Novosphingobium sp. CF614]|uniref:hypothetical protein n=1 Tax=Novosphingobium sp. CF614 TaxID=1884364 RepID=UPI0008E0D37C|nr:hypothetical protein [Novosphingobium sp. CF614]SFF99284.1 hypothetical protein SAMN05518801_10558 [Novosphingobium sp. CF614]
MAFELPLALAAVTAQAGTPATLDQFEAVLASHDSATRALEQWCAARRIADPPVVHAKIVSTAGNDPPAGMRRRLGVGPDDPLGMRNVALSCGGIVLSVAWNWYVPARLTPAMNEALGRSDTPFGKVAAPLGFRRKAIATIAGPAERCPAATISTHLAMLYLPDGEPLAYVVECYTAAILSAGG